jgi:large repetitive protein
VLQHITLDDPDAGDSDISATITLPSGFLVNSLGGVAMSAGASGTLNGTHYDVGSDAQGHSTITLTGSITDVQAALNTVGIKMPASTAEKDNNALWNGTFQVQLVVNDLTNHGSRPDQDTLNDDAAYNDTHYTGSVGDHYSYADNTANSTDAALVTTRLINVTISSGLQVREEGLTSDGLAGSQATDGSWTFALSNGLDSVTFGGSAGTTLTLTAAQLASLGSMSEASRTLDTPNGALLITGYTDNGDGTTTLTYHYVLTGAVQQPGATSSNDTISVTTTDSEQSVNRGEIVVNIVDDAPTAYDDAAEVTEDSHQAATGNVVTDAGTSGKPDRLGADDPGASPVTGVGIGVGATPVAGNVGTLISGQYGHLTLNADGSYSYLADDDNAAVNALKDGDTLKDSFTYQITDKDGDKATATLTITIKGHTDGAPTITAVDKNGTANGNVTVYEKGLVDGDDSQIQKSSIDFTAPDGLTSIWIGGMEVTLAQLRALGNGNTLNLVSSDGTLTLTGFTVTDSVGGVPTAGSVAYTFTLTHAPTVNTSALQENYALSITDAGKAKVDGDALGILIIDDAPTAKDDAGTVTEDGPAATGDVVHGDANGGVADRVGADATASPVTGVALGDTGTTATDNVGSALVGTYGTIVLKADGTYTYTLDNTNPTVNALKDNSQPLTETFTYTITDADGDTSTAKLVITIHGKTDGTPAVTVKDNNGAATGDATVYEAGLVDMPGGDVTSGKITVVAADGLSGVTFQWGTDTVTLSLDELSEIHQGILRVGFSSAYGTLEINGFDTTTSVGGVPTEGKISYTYTLTTAPSVAGDNVADTFHLTVVDASGARSAVSDFVVNIVNDKPIANADASEVTEDSGVNATGNVITATGAHDVADRVGADGATVTGVSADLGGGATSTGTVGSALDGQYGRLTLNSDGSYTYELDDSNPTVNALKDGSTPLTETFTYTITDGDGDTSQTTLVISIKGHTDGTLTVGPDGGNSTNGTGGAATVWEAGLTTDGAAADKSSVDGTLDIASPDGLSSVVIGGKTISAGELADLHNGGSPITITTADGSTLLITDFTVIDSTGGAATQSTISYTYTLNGPRDQVGSDHENDTIALEVNDAGGGNATGSLVVTIMNDVPVAKGDTSDAYEDGAGASGNVIGMGGATAPGLGDVTDRPGADGGIHVTGVHAGDTGGTVTGSVGGTVVGQYGTLTLNSDGSYSYAVDNDNPDVNALKDGSQPLTDTYTYTITDADGDTSTATLTIRIHGNTDGAPTVTPADGNGAASGHATVYEPGLTPDGPTGESATATGTIDLTSPDGLTSVTVGGTTLTTADLDAIHNGTPVTIQTPDGTLVLTDFVATTNTAGTITTGGTLSYTYTLDHAVGQTGAADTTDDIGLVVTDAGGSDVHGTLSIDIVNDTPTANHDTGDVNEDGAPLTGNVVTGSTHGDVPDRVGADATASPVTGVEAGTAPGAVSGHVGTGVAGQYGTLTLNADGSYSYAVDNTNPVVNALKDGVSLTETYTYTITDADGDASTTTLTITIHGHTDGAPVIGAVDGNGSATGHATVHESGLAEHDGSQTTTGTLTVTAGDGLASVTIGGTTLTADQLGQLSGGHPVTIHTPDGTLVLTGFQATATNGSVPTAGTISYTYTLDHALSQNGPDSTDTIALTVVDRGGGTSNGTLVVDIANDVPVAHDDSATIVQDSGQTSATGNVYVGSDRIGADGAATGGPVTAVSSQNTGHAGVIGGGSAGAYGTLVLNADGSYSYKLDVANPKVSSLDASRTLTEVFVYTITDADGDTSTATLTLTIHGTTPPIQAKGDEIWPIGYDHTQRDIRQAWEPGLFVLPDGVAFSQKLLEDIEADRRVGENDFARDHSPLWDDFSPFAPAKVAEKHATDKHHHAHEKDHAKHVAQRAPHASYEPPQVPVAIHVPPPASTPGGAPSLSARIAAMAKASHPVIAAVPTTQPRH